MFLRLLLQVNGLRRPQQLSGGTWRAMGGVMGLSPAMSGKCRTAVSGQCSRLHGIHVNHENYRRNLRGKMEK